MNIIFAKQLLWGFWGKGSDLITYVYVNAWGFLALAGHSVFHMHDFHVFNKYDKQKGFEVGFSLIYLF